MTNQLMLMKTVIKDDLKTLEADKSPKAKLLHTYNLQALKNISSLIDQTYTMRDMCKQ
jgi:hypothetical protein